MAKRIAFVCDRCGQDDIEINFDCSYFLCQSCRAVKNKMDGWDFDDDNEKSPTTNKVVGDNLRFDETG